METMGEAAAAETKTEQGQEQASSIFRKARTTLTSFYLKRFQKVLPVEKEAKFCSICLEEGGVCRKCCLGISCDHCYT